MKKLINLIALVMLVSTNVLTPFSYAQEKTPEVIPENEMENVVEVGETPEINEEISEVSEETPGANPEEKGEIEQENVVDVAPENVLPDIQEDVESPTTDETENVDTESDEVAQSEEENAEIEKQEENLEGDEMEEELGLQKIDEPTIMEEEPGTSVTLLPGQEFNSVIKTLANGGTEVAYTEVDDNIQSFQRVDVEPTGVTTGEISETGAEYPVYARFSGGVLYYSTKAEIIQMNENSQNMFQNFSGLTGLDLSNFDTSNVTNMSRMFSGCANIEDLILDNWDFSNNPNIGGMFLGLSSLKTLSAKNWIIPETFNSAFGCTNAMLCAENITIDVSNWDLSKAKNLKQLFFISYAKEIKGLDTWDTSKITNMNSMFRYSNKVTKLDISNWDTSNVTDMAYMFYECHKLKDIDVSNWDTSRVESMHYMFRDCHEIVEMDLSKWDTRSLTDVNSMFMYCNNLKKLNLNNWDTSKVTHIDQIFNSCYKLEELSMSGRDFRNIDASNLFVSKMSSGGWSALKKLNMTNTKFSGSMSYAFLGISGIEEIKFDGIDTSNVTGMRSMFDGCKNLVSLDLSSFDTSNVVNMGSMFRDCTGLVNLNLSGWDFRKVGAQNLINNISLWSSPLKTLNMTNAKFSGSMQQAFQGLSSKTGISLNLDNIDTSNVTNMAAMFQDCKGLTGLNVSGWDTSNVTNMSQMFYGCSGLHSLDLNSLDVSKVTNMYGMFYGCSGLANLDINNLNTSNVMYMSQMFSECSSLTGLDLSNWETRGVVNMGGIFQKCNNLEYINLSGWDFRKYSNAALMMNMTDGGIPSLKKLNMANTKYTGNATYAFGGLDKLEELNLNGADTRGVTNMTAMFNGDSKLKDLDLGSFDTSNVTDMSAMFYNCSTLTGLDLSSFDTSNVTNIGQMFYGCSSLTGLDLSKFDTSNVINMGFGNGGIFGGCNKLEELNLSGWDFKGVSNNQLMMYVMRGTPQSLKKLNMTNTKYTGNATYAFGGLNKLEELNLNGADTSNVTSMTAMFNGDSKLKDLDLSSFDTSNVTDMSAMFYNCSTLTGLNVGWFDTNKVTSMGAMFNGCSSLDELDLSNFDTSKVVTMGQMFYNTPNLKTIYASENFVTTALSGDNSSKDMFSGTTNVIGGNGTKFDPNYIDRTYAKIDKVGQTGYFTDKNAINVKFINTLDGTETTSTFAKGQKLTPPYVDKYHVVGGYLDEELTQAIDLNEGVDTYSVIYIKYERNGSSGGGGGGGATKPDTPKDEQQPAEPSQSDASTGTNIKEPESNTGSNIQTGIQVDSSEQTTQNDNSNIQDSPTSSQDDTKIYSTEFQEAYEFAKGNGITTMPTIQKANMEGKLTRIAMAKMLSQYAVNVLGKTPDTSKTVKFKDVSNKKDADYDNGVTLAYQLGIMGQNMPNNRFRPNDEVTRAEFATALSRMAYNTSDGEYKSTSKYYIHHMEKLVKEGIITNDNPNMKELRGYVMIMLMRGAK